MFVKGQFSELDFGFTDCACCNKKIQKHLGSRKFCFAREQTLAEFEKAKNSDSYVV
jgi:hypothetical protein